MPIAMLICSNSAFKVKMVVSVPAPAISGKAMGTIEALAVASGSGLKSSIPKILAPSGSINDHGFENVVSIAVRGVNGDRKVHGFLVNNSIVCATLAHGVKGDPVLEHAFWGTDLVLDAIKDMKTRAKKRGIMNPIVGTGPFSWKFAPSPSPSPSPHPNPKIECIGIAEAELVMPFAPRLTSKQIRHKTKMLEIVKNALLNPSSMFLVSEVSGNEGDDGNEF